MRLSLAVQTSLPTAYGRQRARSVVWAGVLLGVLLPGCAPSPERSLKNPDPSGKIPAIKQAAQSRNDKAEPDLIRNLSDEDPAVRFYAIEALRRLTGQTFGYLYYDDDDHRQAAVQRWQQWLAAGAKLK